MKHIHFDVKTGGFYGAYWKNKKETNCAIIAMLGDDPEDYMAKSCVKWLMKKGVNVLTMSPAKKNYSHHNYPLERIESAIKWLKDNGNKKIGIAGASTTGTLALTAASYFNDLTLTIAMTRAILYGRALNKARKTVAASGLSRANRCLHIAEARSRICRFVTNIPSIGWLCVRKVKRTITWRIRARFLTIPKPLTP